MRSNGLPTLSRASVLFTLAAWLAAGVGASVGASAADKEKPTDVIVLFDGKSLDGWEKTRLSSPGEVKVADGAIVLGEGEPMTGITTTRRDLPTTDYELRYEARRLSGDDFFAAATFPVGKSFITLVNGGWGGNVTGLSSLNGADASENETNHYVQYKNNTWYRFRVRVTSRMIRCWVDDEPVIAVDHSDREVGTRVETRRNQPLGFATYRSTGAVRAVQVRRLTPDEVAACNKPD